MQDLLDLVVFDTPYAWILLGVTFVITFLIPGMFKVKLWNGLFFAQTTFFFSAATIIPGLSTGVITADRGIHFFIVETSFLVAIYAVYARLLKNRYRVLSALTKLFNGPFAGVLVGFIALIAIFNLVVTPTDGSSRIEYMTNAWFSFVKPFVMLLTPISYFGVFILLLNRRRRRLGYILLLFTVVANILTGSKAAFAINLLSAFLALRDLSGTSRIQIRFSDKLKIGIFTGAMVLVALSRLEITTNDIVSRTLLFGEANLLTYYSSEPTAACQNVSTFAKMHRGLARLVGDQSANNIDTLFGYALMIKAIGVNTFTGPNARLSAYALCNFPGESLTLGVIVVLGYFGLLLAVFMRSLNRATHLAIFYPFFIKSLNSAAVDFNVIMQDITIYCVLLLSTILIYAKPKPQLR